MPVFKIKDTVKVFMTYVYEVEADTIEEAELKYNNELAGSLEQKDSYLSDDTSESVVAEK